ncbi:MAG: SGNH/GDSL hydrolase family protein [Myxococcota bacterium]
MTRGRKLAFALATLAILVGVFEVVARVAGVCACKPPEPSVGTWDEMQADTRYLWRLTPGHEMQGPGGTVTRINELGLRETFLPRPKAPNERRIVTTGDSSVYGWGIPQGQTYQERLEQALKQRWPQYHFEVINLGVPGYSTVQSLRLLEDVGWRYEPDVLVISNVFSDCNIDAFQDERALSLVSPEESPLRASRTYCAIWNGYASWYATYNQERNRVLMPGIPRYMELKEKVDQVVDLSRVPIDDYVANLEAMRAAAAARGARVVVAPLAQEWDVGRWTVPGMPKPSPGQVFPWTPYREAMKAFAERHQLGFVSMPEAFAAVQGPKERLFSDPVHPGPDGAAVMARALADFFARRPDVLDVR